MISEKFKNDLFKSYRKYTLEKGLERVHITEDGFNIFFFEKAYKYIFSISIHIKIDIFTEFLKDIEI